MLSSGTYGTLTNLSSLKGDNDVSLFLGQLQLVGLSKVLGLVGIRALDAGRRKDCREQAGERQGGVTTSQVASLLESVGGVTGDGVDASLSVDDGIRKWFTYWLLCSNLESCHMVFPATNLQVLQHLCVKLHLKFVKDIAENNMVRKTLDTP